MRSIIGCFRRQHESESSENDSDHDTDPDYDPITTRRRRRQTSDQRYRPSRRNRTIEQREVENTEQLETRREINRIQQRRSRQRRRDNSHQLVRLPPSNYLGKMEKECPYCGALTFPGASFNCCSNGKIYLPPPRIAPEPLLSLLTDRTPMANFFRDRCKATNSAFAFASVQYNKVPVGLGGVQTEKVKGDIHHIPSMVYARKKLAFANFYVYDWKEAAKQRSQGSLAGQLQPEVVEQLSQMFEECNELAKSYKHMHEICQQYRGDDRQKLKLLTMRLVNRFELTEEQKTRLEGEPGQYHLPDDPDMVAALYNVDSEGAAYPKGLLVYPNTNPNVPPKPLSYFSSLCDPVCYPLICPYGEIGWAHKGTRLCSREEAEQRRMERSGDTDILMESDDEDDFEDDELAEQANTIWDPLSGDPNLEASEVYFDNQNDEDASRNLDVVNFVESQGEIRPVVFDGGQGEEHDTNVEDRLFFPSVQHDSDSDESEQIREWEAQNRYRNIPELDQVDYEGSSDVEMTDEENDLENYEDIPQEDEQLGRNQTLRHGKQRFASIRQYYNYRYQKRSGERYNKYTATRKLGQLHMIDVFCRMNNQRFEAIRKFYTHDMITSKSRLFKVMSRQAERRGRTLGMLVTVPKTVIGSPRYYRSKYQDAISIVNKVGKADLFLTFTGNREWKEIKENVPKVQGHAWCDEAMLVVNVFKEKKKLFLDMVIGKKGRDGLWHGGIFGSVKAFVYSVEFQQRGMPHIHLLITLKDKLNDVAKIDRLISAELPEVPDESDELYEEKKRLRELVEKYMVHSPCEGVSTAYCQLGKDPRKRLCNKRFPKKFQEYTTLGRDGYAELQRRNNGERSGRNGADNSYVVPYCPLILATFECHVNVEVVTNITPIRYIYKYIMKGFDRVLLETTERVSIDDGTDCGTGTVGYMDVSGHLLHPKGINIPTEVREMEENRIKKALLKAHIQPVINGVPVVVQDETIYIKELRATTSIEAAHHIAAYETTESSHIVVTLPVHLPDEEAIFFTSGEEAERARYVEEHDPETKLKAFFTLCQEDEEARQRSYAEVPLYYTYTKGKWRKRRRDWSKRMVGRIPPVQPRFLERFALRLLAMEIKGAQSFDDFITVDGQKKRSFLEAAQERGLMNGQQVWQKTMNEGASEMMPNALRHLFATILVFGAPTNPFALWEEFKGEMYERKNWTREKKQARALQHISNILERNGCSLNQFHLPVVDVQHVGDTTTVDEDGWTVPSGSNSEEIGKRMMEQLNEEQRKVVKKILGSLNTANRNNCYFLDGPGGSGKTFIYNTLYHVLSGKGMKILNVAHTGIAATNLPRGSTVHRSFGIPLQLQEDVNSTIEFESSQAAQLRELDGVIWDEGTMSDKRIYECVDRLLQAITGIEKPFGGKLMLIGGDWRQLLPIVENVSNEGVLEYTLKASILWNEFEVLHLNHNVRAMDDPEYSTLIEKVGKGEEMVDGRVRLPSKILLKSEEEVVDWVFGNRDLNNTDAIKGSCILTLDNVSCQELNEKVLNMLQNGEKTYKSIDATLDEKSFVAIPTETYNKLTPSGLPPHELHVKQNCIVILLRNLDVHLALCNGTRLRVVKMMDDLILCEILMTKRIVGIPRICMSSTTTLKGELAFMRTQFPLKLAYSLTVNKSQGQTLDRMGLILRTPPFAHGQLYVALSRVRSVKDIKMSHYDTFEKDAQGKPIVLCRNVVYTQIL